MRKFAFAGHPPTAITQTFLAWQSWLPAFLFCIVVSVSSRWWIAYEFNPDEGLEVGKALLMARGYELYNDIWNDQPPLFSGVLVLLEYVFPESVAAKRLFVLICSVLALHAFFNIVRRQAGIFGAWMATLLLATFGVYPAISVSVMAGIPAIAVILVCFDLLTGKRGTSAAKIALAGLLFGFSLQFKLFVVVAAPALCLTVLTESRAEWPVRLTLICLAGLATAISFFGIGWWFDLPIRDQALAPHFTEQLRAKHTIGASVDRIMGYLRGDTFLLVLGVLGAVAAVFSSDRRLLVPILWVVCSVISLLFHYPVWNHHLILIAAPLAWLGGFFAKTLLDILGRSIDRRSVKWVVSAVLLWLAADSYRPPISVESELGPAAVQSLGQNLDESADWVLSDKPMDAYRVGLLVPPELVVWSHKRVNAGNLGTPDILKALAQRRPHQVLLRRFPVPGEVQHYLQEHYRPQPNENGFAHFIRKTETTD